MDRRRLGDNATFALTVEEQSRVTAVLQDWFGEGDPYYQMHVPIMTLHP